MISVYPNRHWPLLVYVFFLAIAKTSHQRFNYVLDLEFDYKAQDYIPSDNSPKSSFHNRKFTYALKATLMRKSISESDECPTAVSLNKQLVDDGSSGYTYMNPFINRKTHFLRTPIVSLRMMFIPDDSFEGGQSSDLHDHIFKNDLDFIEGKLIQMNDNDKHEVLDLLYKSQRPIRPSKSSIDLSHHIFIGLKTPSIRYSFCSGNHVIPTFYRMKKESWQNFGYTGQGLFRPIEVSYEPREGLNYFIVLRKLPKPTSIKLIFESKIDKFRRCIGFTSNWTTSSQKPHSDSHQEASQITTIFSDFSNRADDKSVLCIDLSPILKSHHLVFDQNFTSNSCSGNQLTFPRHKVDAKGDKKSIEFYFWMILKEELTEHNLQEFLSSGPIQDSLRLLPKHILNPRFSHVFHSPNNPSGHYIYRSAHTFNVKFFAQSSVVFQEDTLVITESVSSFNAIDWEKFDFNAKRLNKLVNFLNSPQLASFYQMMQTNEADREGLPVMIFFQPPNYLNFKTIIQQYFQSMYVQIDKFRFYKNKKYETHTLGLIAQSLSLTFERQSVQNEIVKDEGFCSQIVSEMTDMVNGKTKQTRYNQISMLSAIIEDMCDPSFGYDINNYLESLSISRWTVLGSCEKLSKFTDKPIDCDIFNRESPQDKNTEVFFRELWDKFTHIKSQTEFAASTFRQFSAEDVWKQCPHIGESLTKLPDSPIFNTNNEQRSKSFFKVLYESWGKLHLLAENYIRSLIEPQVVPNGQNAEAQETFLNNKKRLESISHQLNQLAILESWAPLVLFERFNEVAQSICVFYEVQCDGFTTSKLRSDVERAANIMTSTNMDLLEQLAINNFSSSTSYFSKKSELDKARKHLEDQSRSVVISEAVATVLHAAITMKKAIKNVTLSGPLVFRSQKFELFHGEAKGTPVYVLADHNCAYVEFSGKTSSGNLFVVDKDSIEGVNARSTHMTLFDSPSTFKIGSFALEGQPNSLTLTPYTRASVSNAIRFESRSSEIQSIL